MERWRTLWQRHAHACIRLLANGLRMPEWLIQAYLNGFISGVVPFLQMPSYIFITTGVMLVLVGCERVATNKEMFESYMETSTKYKKMNTQ
jgi:hypothetical protein